VNVAIYEPGKGEEARGIHSVTTCQPCFSDVDDAAVTDVQGRLLSTPRRYDDATIHGQVSGFAHFCVSGEAFVLGYLPLG
jgi:hypothetical protein